MIASFGMALRYSFDMGVLLRILLRYRLFLGRAPPCLMNPSGSCPALQKTMT